MKGSVVPCEPQEMIYGLKKNGAGQKKTADENYYAEEAKLGSFGLLTTLVSGLTKMRKQKVGECCMVS